LTVSPLASRSSIVAAALLFSTGGAAIKASSLTSWQIASFRSAVAVLVVLCLMPRSRRGFGVRSFAVGAAYAATMVLFVTSTKLTTAANAIFLQYTAPAYVLLLEPWLLAERFRARDLVYLVVLGLGLSLFAVGGDASGTTAPNPALGNALALLSGVSWALTAIGLRWMTRAESADGGATAETAVVCGNLIAATACAPFALPVSSAAPIDWLVVLYLGVFQISAAYFFLTRGLRNLSALETSLALLLEPVLNPVWAWLVHGEDPGRFAVAGGAVILLATAVRTWNETRRARGG
jgi:drug/metabolite transporter (DMT)-like permease